MSRAKIHDSGGLLLKRQVNWILYLGAFLLRTRSPSSAITPDSATTRVMRSSLGTWRYTTVFYRPS
jgi:hypothetical protein